MLGKKACRLARNAKLLLFWFLTHQTVDKLGYFLDGQTIPKCQKKYGEDRSGNHRYYKTACECICIDPD